MDAKIKMLKVTDLLIDPSYQRQLDEKRVQRVAKAFSSGASKALSVSQRGDGSLYVYDGQHTLAVCVALGMELCPAVVVRGSQEQEARWFLLMNGAGVSKATARESHKAALTADDEIAKQVQDLLDEHGVLLAKGGAKAGTTSAIGSLKIWCKSDKARLQRAMGVIDRLWCCDDHAWSQIILRGMVDIAGDADLLEAVESGLARARITPRRVLDVAAGMQSATGVPGGGSGYSKSAILQLSKVRSA